jgi:DNA-binding beta-propeller fold protein YncE/ribosomal protein S27E
VPRTFDCPKCGAPVEFSNNPTAPDFTVRCNYCGSALSEPSMGRPAQIVHLKIDTPANFRFPKWLLLILLIPLLGVLAGILSMVAGFAPLFISKNRNLNTNNSRGGPTTIPRGGTTKEPEFASVLLKFGTEGIGPGMFTDARSIAIDPDGNIYVGEYSGGRIQVFDSNGKFVTQWTANPKMPLRGLAADRKGNVYVVQSGKIDKFEGATGKSLGAIKFGEGWGFDDVAMAADGTVVAPWSRGSDDIVKMDANGNVLRHIKAAISSVTDRSELNIRVAIDGSGNIYALGTFNNAVFKFNPEGKYVNKFGGDGDKPGQFRAPGAIAVDGFGKIYVSDIKGIQVFDNEGRFLRVFRVDGSNASGMIFNDKNELFLVDRTKVLKAALKDS